MAKTIPQAAWCGDLAAMIQVSFVGYAVGGAFLDIGYFDLPYNMMVLIVLSKCWIDRKAWIDEAQHSPPRWKIPGVASIAK